MATKPKPVPDAAEAEPPKKSSKKILVILAVAVLAVGGAAGWYFTSGPGGSAHAPEAAKPVVDPKFFTLEPFTVNLQKEESDQFLQVGITLKVANSGLEDQLKQNLPEIRSRLLMLLSSKHASELTSVEGKLKLSGEIIAEIQRTLKLPVEAPAPAAVAAEGESGVPAAAAKPGNIEVLFTSFIIQ